MTIPVDTVSGVFRVIENGHRMQDAYQFRAAVMVACVHPSCSFIKLMSESNFRRGYSFHRGCVLYPRKTPFRKPKEEQAVPIEVFIGEKFNRWEVIGPIETTARPTGRPRRKVPCKCECGQEQLVVLDDLVNNRSTQCRPCGFANRVRTSKLKDGE